MRTAVAAAVLAVTSGLGACGGPGSAGPDAAGVDGAGAAAATCSAWLATHRASLPDLVPAGNQATRERFLGAGGALVAVEDTYAGVWFPEGHWSGGPRRIVVTLHGTTGAPEYEWSDFHEALAARGWGFVGLAYYYRDRAAPADYSDGATLHARIEAVLAELAGPCGADSAAVSLMGFSRGSAQAFEVLARDRAGAARLRGVVANAGAWVPTGRPTPYLADLDQRGDTTALTGASLWMYCGSEDRALGVPMCDVMINARAWVERHGATVAALYQNPGAGHHSMYATPAAVTQAFDFLAAQ